MCGIVGFAGNIDGSRLIVQGLKNLEYRGYDSWGLALKHSRGIFVKKKVGKIAEFDADKSGLPESKLGLGHTRWSTHGAVTEINAHPHFSCNKKIAVVHNGIIENFQELKSELKRKGHKFKSQTDSEVVPHLIEEEMKKQKNARKAFLSALKKLRGNFALLALVSGENELFAARKDSPLIIGLSDNGNFIASDVSAFFDSTNKVIFLNDFEGAFVGKEIELFNFKSGKKILRKPEKINWTIEGNGTSKSRHRHFMHKEIFEQPASIERAFRGRVSGSMVQFSGLDFSEKFVKSIERIVVLGCGTSWHAGLIGEFFLERLAGIPVEVEYASEFRYRNPVIDSKTLCIAISQSGETADTLAALREAQKKGAKVLSIANVMGSSISRESDFVLYTNSGPEIGVASTKAFTGQIAVLLLLSVFLGRKKGFLKRGKETEIISSLKKLPSLVAKALASENAVKKIAKHYYKKTNALFLGRGLNYPVALEGALKLKEISYIHAEGYPAAEMKHGPIALIDKKMPVVFIAVKDSSYEKLLGNIQEVRARGGKVIIVATEKDREIKKFADEIIFIPSANELLLPFLSVVPLQLLAYHIALRRNCDIDKPRNLAKSCTVE